MQVVPVIDLMGGEVVRARMGDRASYRPLESPLSPTSDPVAVVRGLLAVYPFPTLYVADLDAIQSNGDNFPALRRIRAEFPALQMWVDNGAADRAALEAADRRRSRHAGHRQRIATRQQADCAAPGLDCASCSRSIFAATRFRARSEILDEPALWPRRVIVMTLARVGSGAGPGSRAASRRSARSPASVKSMPREACATRPIS